MQLNNSGPHQIPIRDKQGINNRLRNIKHHLSNNNSNNRECLPKLANTVNQLQSAGSSNLPSQTIPNPRGNANAVTLRTVVEISLSRFVVSARYNCPIVISISARKPESDEELLKMFWKVEAERIKMTKNELISVSLDRGGRGPGFGKLEVVGADALRWMETSTSSHQRCTIAVLPRRLSGKVDSLETLNFSPCTRELSTIWLFSPKKGGSPEISRAIFLTRADRGCVHTLLELVKALKKEASHWRVIKLDQG
ncbi:hypothetical protein CR513_55177, partial [Mucuna pruriens]